MSCDLLEQALDALAEGAEVPVLVSFAAQNAQKQSTQEIRAFSDDASNECLEAARAWISNNTDIIRYVLLYDGDIADEDGVYQKALIIEFAERGGPCAFSGYVCYESAGDPDNFSWSEPRPAGACDSLV